MTFTGVNAGVVAGDIGVSGLGAGGAGPRLLRQRDHLHGPVGRPFPEAAPDRSASTWQGRSGNAPITVTEGGTISGVDTGIRLGVAGSPADTANAAFRFGGGSVGGVTAALDARGLVASSGTYAFGATRFTGPQLFDSNKVVFVGSAATGAGDGSTVNDLATIDFADAITDPNAIFALVNDGSPIVTRRLHTVGRPDAGLVRQRPDFPRRRNAGERDRRQHPFGLHAVRPDRQRRRHADGAARAPARP